MWDLRTPLANKHVQSIAAHAREVNCLVFYPFNEWVVATGSTDKTVKLFDLRELNTALHTFHKEEVFQAGWSPKNETILALCCLGRRLMVWDLSRYVIWIHDCCTYSPLPFYSLREKAVFFLKQKREPLSQSSHYSSEATLNPLTLTSKTTSKG